MSARLTDGAIPIVDGQANVTDVPVERVAVNQQEHRRNQQQDRQRAPVAHDLTDLLQADAERFTHGPLSPGGRPRHDVEEHVLERRLHRHDIRHRDVFTFETALERVGDVRVASFHDGVNGRSEEAGLLDIGLLVEDAHRLHRTPRLNLENGAVGEYLFELAGRAERREFARVDDRDAMTVLRFVKIVRRHQHGHAGLGEMIDQASRTGGARADRLRRSARRETRSAARGGWRSRAPDADATRRPDPRSSCARGP